MLNQSTIRVAQIVGFATEGGVESYIMNYYKEIDHNKVQFDFFIEEGSTSKIIIPEKIEKLGGKVIYIPKLKSMLLNDRKLVKLLKDGNYDIVHANKTSLNFFYLKAAKKAGIKIRISHAHTTSTKKEFLRNIVKNFLKLFSKKYATHYVACSEIAGRWLFGNKAYNEGKVTIINNAIDLKRYKFNAELRKEIRENLGVENKFVVGHVGRFMKQKNHLFLLDIFYEIQKIAPDSVLLLIGDGPLHEKIVKKIENLGLKDKVILSGVHKHPERFYQAMDVFVFPSFYEGLGMVLIEAQISGLPCYVSKEVPKEAKINESVEFLELKDSKKWAKAIILEKENNRFNYYKSFIYSKYDLENETKKLSSYYEGCLLK